MSDKKAQTPKRGIKLKPCIAEMLRTQVCPTKPTFLLDRVIVVTLPHGRDGNSNAYRLYLSDGEKTIQALLTSEIHRIFIYEEAKEGSYLVLDKYKLKRGKRLFGNGDVAFLAIAEFHEIGYQPRFKWTGNFEPNALLHDLSEREAKRYPPERHTNSKQKERDYSGFVARDPKPDDQLVDWIQRYDRCYDSASEGDEENNGGGIWKGSGKRKRTSGAGVLQELSANRLDFPHHDREPKKPKQADSSELDTTKTCASLPKSLMFYEHEIMEHHKRCQIGLLKHCPRCECTVCRPLLRGTSATTNLQPQRTASTAASALSLASITLSQYAIRALEVGKPLQPIDRWLNIHRLINFADIMRVSPLVDVLAVVQWVDNKTFKRGSSLLTRHIRIVDQSTWKKVLLSVSVDAVNFTPAVGTIALFRNLRWCKFDGGSLVADNFDCEGKDWFIPNPIGIVPESTVKQLREEWETLQE
ncbi:hypothetical protein MMC08_007122, partial [Hypocenomyce scalaris]|nr:hypothetical protein [Hypocenomyce scalaris]